MKKVIIATAFALALAVSGNAIAGDIPASEQTKMADAWERCGEAAVKFEADERYNYEADGCTDEDMGYALWHYDLNCE